jgi:formyltetrahydrofolate-dependent phosphoribosylglycinamide formyltransferase
MTALLQAACAPDYPAEITLVISNRPDAAGLKSAQALNVETLCVNHVDFETREEFETALDNALRERGIRLIALAGFMRVLTEGFTKRWAGKLINVHPSLLPSFKGLHTHERAIEAGVALHGCTVHFVNEGVDTGAIIGQAAVPVHFGDTPDTLGARVLEAEHALFPLCLGYVAMGHVKMHNGRTRWKTRPATGSGNELILNPAK